MLTGVENEQKALYLIMQDFDIFFRGLDGGIGCHASLVIRPFIMVPTVNLEEFLVMINAAIKYRRCFAPRLFVG